jgi:hypothetical protein
MTNQETPQSASAGTGAGNLIGAKLPSLPAAGTEPANAKSQGGQGSSLWTKEQRELASFVHMYIRDFIKFADQKAAFIFAVSSAVLTFLLRHDAQKTLLLPVSVRRVSEWIASASVLLVALSGLLSLFVVLPRLRSKGKGLIYWKGIVSAGKSADYLAEVQQLRGEDIAGPILEHCYELAEIADRKYELLKWAMWLGSIGTVAAGWVLLGV